MGIYLNPDNEGFSTSVRSKIYIDKTGLIKYTNSTLCTNQKCICVSRPGLWDLRKRKWKHYAKNSA